eukprot:186439_1
MTIKNAMVILLAIGEYDDEPQTPDQELGFLSNLDVENDVVSLSNLFGHQGLNYSIFPKYNLEYPKVHWTQDEIISLLEAKALQLSENKENFDGLVVAVSSHGWLNSVCTSDYKLINKIAIHRIFTTNYPQTREIPRVFLFDCCSGSDEQGLNDSDSDSEDDDNGKAGNIIKDTAKGFQVEDLDRNDYIWEHGTKNPDHKLAIVHAANYGFQSKLNSDIGSYMLYEFSSKTLDDILNKDNRSKDKKYIYEVFDEIQQELAERGKQQIVTSYSDKTRFIKFKKNENDNQNDNVERENINTHESTKE